MASSTCLVNLVKYILFRAYINFMGYETLLIGLETHPSTCYILSDESGIPLYSRSNGNTICIQIKKTRKNAKVSWMPNCSLSIFCV